MAGLKLGGCGWTDAREGVDWTDAREGVDWTTTLGRVWLD